jgi:CDGSH-type Zn-finger protein
MACTCGFSTDYPNCNGTHKTVKMVKTKILQKINAIDLSTDENKELNALGMKMIILKEIADL